MCDIGVNYILWIPGTNASFTVTYLTMTMLFSVKLQIGTKLLYPEGKGAADDATWYYPIFSFTIWLVYETVICSTYDLKANRQSVQST